ncbi:3-deoxy-D-manno-octulosonic acid transferase [Pelagibacteraceae bacterium]|nr:3-deoxy-D-manno-octulosonic acid transferase [Pelagibacteraceae bacterium]
MYFWYKLLTYLFYPFANIYLILRKLKKKEHSTRYKEKLSKITLEKEKGLLIWFHVASVGEGLSILPLVKILEKEEKVKSILITSITLSSSEVFKKKISQSKKIIHQFLPLDIPVFIDKFLNHWQPDLSIFIDSEIWPNLILKIKIKNIPLLLINARITKKTFLRWNSASSFAEKIFKKFDLFIVANKETEKYLKDLGGKNIKNYGNLKFIKSELDVDEKININNLKKIMHRKMWCAASTHPSEEIFCAKTHSLLKKKYQNILTIIIPRHINRVRDIEIELNKLNLTTCLYSKFEEINNNTDILIVDAYGETAKIFQVAKYVFLGGSLIKHGGHNPIEPSRLGCKIFHGQSIENFTEIYEFLRSLKITNQIQNDVDLSLLLVEEFESGKTHGNEIIEQIDNYGQNVLNNVMNEIKKYINI